MHELIGTELYQAMSYARSLDEQAGRQLLVQFQQEQPGLAQVLLEMFPSIIAEHDQDMAYLFMDLCFDVLCIFQRVFGALPTLEQMDKNWLEKQAALLETEFQAVLNGQTMDPKLKTELLNRMQRRGLEDNSQPALLKILLETIVDFSAESPKRANALEITQNFISIVVYLFGQLYSNKAVH